MWGRVVRQGVYVHLDIVASAEKRHLSTLWLLWDKDRQMKSASQIAILKTIVKWQAEEIEALEEQVTVLKGRGA